MKPFFAALLLIGAPCFGAAPPDARTIIGHAFDVPPGGIREDKAVTIGGIPQWISVRGSDAKNPILLYIHGGPGSTMLPESWTFQRPWEDFFTVVQWDQRGAGKTFSLAKRKAAALTLEQMQSDAEEVVDYLRRTYGKDKIFVMGHSWGSILGLTLAQHHPEWLYAYVGVGQVISSQRNEVVGYQETLAKARAEHNEEAIRALEKIAPYPPANGELSFENVMVERQWDRALGGMRFSRSGDDEEIASLSPAYSAYDRKSADMGQQTSLISLLPALRHIDFEATTTFKCPVIFFAGAEDRTTPTSIVEDYFPHVQAPVKKLFKIERAAHYVVNESPGVVLMHLVNDVRPLATTP